MSEVGSRRTEGLRVGGRSARVVDEVLRATLEELGASGYAGLRVDDVARRSGVNKTTIYRRWPTKVELVAAAIRSARSEEDEPPDRGSVRADLLALADELRVLAANPSRFAIARMLHAELLHPEVASIKLQLREEGRKRRGIVIERAVARGELPAGTDPALVCDAIFTTLAVRLIGLGEPWDGAYATRIVDLVLDGARGQGKKPAK